VNLTVQVKHCKRANVRPTMQARFVKLCKETGLVGRGLSTTDADLVFATCKDRSARRINFEQVVTPFHTVARPGPLYMPRCCHMGCIQRSRMFQAVKSSHAALARLKGLALTTHPSRMQTGACSFWTLWTLQAPAAASPWQPSCGAWRVLPAQRRTAPPPASMCASMTTGAPIQVGYALGLYLLAASPNCLSEVSGLRYMPPAAS
jgi:hypothetical protein